MKSISLLVLLLLAQKPAEKPKVHADFYFGSYPTSREAATLMSDEKARLVVVGFHEGWSPNKIAKELKLSEPELSKMADKLEEERLAGRRTEYDLRPFMPVIRERDFDRVKDSLRRHTQEFSRLLQGNWSEIEGLVDSLSGAKSVPKDRAMYETVVSGILLGGMIDAFYEDKTLMVPGGPRRGKNERFYAWFVESNPDTAGKLKRELRESDGYRIVSIGISLPDEKLNASDLRGKATVLETDEARRYRVFINLFSRDKLFPFFKSRRDEFLKLGSLLSSGRYIAFAEFFAWYYNAMANGVVDELIAARRIAAPEKYYIYAVKSPQ